MSPRHHLHVTTLMGFATGALTPAFTAVVAAHLSLCPECRARLALADAVGGQLVEQQHGLSLTAGAADAMRERLTVSHEEPAVAPAAEDHVPSPSPMPVSLRPYFGRSLSTLPWRWIGPGIHRVSVRLASDEQLTLLRIAPGRSLPVHSHEGRELTLILSGAYDDALGHFAPGDVADLDEDTEHQPITSRGTACICVAATDAPLRFAGWMARTLQRVLPL
ncbi:ChrR family anti-sigma-E factor [Luteibacter yeojuensis]|uniref:ChrR-like cupin domain-containing protein n=1 Tax=Luteibacter yeojuensis TaxID=345309 RepID=A0A0F3KU35_9GAMM|nr:ChrR family anti-sigma-E factor [Luteibacter yeojuensis]KJV34780.1 hypothetical protein VI08_09335 [Luteibacter yeojuensis]